MVNAGCTTKKQSTTILAFGRTGALAENLKQLIVSDALHVDALSYCTPLDQIRNIHSANAIIIEIDAPAVFNEGIELVKKIRLENFRASIIMAISHTKSFTKVDCYLAGVDHCVKLPADHNEKADFFPRIFQDPEWNSEIKLVLDQACLCLHGPARKLEISYTEMKILDALISAQAHILSHDDIAKALELNIRFYDPRALEKTISRLRGKIRNTYGINAIHSVRGFGYRLCRGVIS